MTKTKWCVIQKTKTKSEFAVKINTGCEHLVLDEKPDTLCFRGSCKINQHQQLT